MYALIILFSGVFAPYTMGMTSQQVSGFKDLETCNTAAHKMQLMQPFIKDSQSNRAEGLGVTQAVCLKVQ